VSTIGSPALTAGLQELIVNHYAEPCLPGQGFLYAPNPDDRGGMRFLNPSRPFLSLMRGNNFIHFNYRDGDYGANGPFNVLTPRRRNDDFNTLVRVPWNHTLRTFEASAFRLGSIIENSRQGDAYPVSNKCNPAVLENLQAAVAAFDEDRFPHAADLLLDAGKKSDVGQEGAMLLEAAYEFISPDRRRMELAQVLSRRWSSVADELGKSAREFERKQKAKERILAKDEFDRGAMYSTQVIALCRALWFAYDVPPEMRDLRRISAMYFTLGGAWKNMDGSFDKGFTLGKLTLTSLLVLLDSPAHRLTKKELAVIRNALANEALKESIFNDEDEEAILSPIREGLEALLGQQL